MKATQRYFMASPRGHAGAALGEQAAVWISGSGDGQ